MDVSVGCWVDNELVEVEWSILPSSMFSLVLWVTVDNHQMRGYDNYWVQNNQYGLYQDPENMVTMYNQSFPGYTYTWWSSGHITKTKDWMPPFDARIVRGVMLADSDARKVGLL